MSEKQEKTFADKYSALRIRARGQHNWVIEGMQTAGIVSRGRHAGKEKKVQWDTVNPIGYFMHLKHAATRLLTEELRLMWPSDGWTGEDMSAAIEAAEERVLAAVADALAAGDQGEND